MLNDNKIVLYTLNSQKPRSHIIGTIVRVSAVLRRTVGGDNDWRFDQLSGSHQQRQVTLMIKIETSINVTSNRATLTRMVILYRLVVLYNKMTV